VRAEHWVAPAELTRGTAATQTELVATSNNSSRAPLDFHHFFALHRRTRFVGQLGDDPSLLHVNNITR
jgi:hypothetical protein